MTWQFNNFSEYSVGFCIGPLAIDIKFIVAHIVLCLLMIKVLKSSSSTLYKISESLPTMFREFPVLKFSELSLLISLQEKVTPKAWPFCYQDPRKFQILKCLLSWRHLYQSPKLDFGHCHFEIVLGSQKVFFVTLFIPTENCQEAEKPATDLAFFTRSECIFSKQSSTLLSSLLSVWGFELIWLKVTWLKSRHKLEW